MVGTGGLCLMSACIMTDSVFFNSILDIRRYPYHKANCI